VNRRDVLRLLATAMAAPRLFAQQRPAPNFLFIMTDDQRQDALSIYGNPILKTPHIDRIGTEGVRLTEFFVTNSLCAPSRASFLTGLYAHTHGVITNQTALRADQETFVHVLRSAGYETALCGKWHLRTAPTGFDSWVILPGGGGPYIDPTMTANGVPLKLRGYADDVVGDQALAYLQNRSRERPFCLLMNFKAPHRNWTPAPRYADAFRDIDVPVPRTFDDTFAGRPAALGKTDMNVADMPDFKERGVPESTPQPERKRRNLQELVRNYYRTILSVDDNVGRVLDFLDTNDLAANTVVLFSSDNGFFLGEHGFYDKRLMYEPSIRVPMLIRFPARLQPRVDSTRLVLNIDVAPTILNLAGVAVPAGMQGRSLVPVLEGAGGPWRDAFLYEFYEFPDPDHCVRKNRGVRTSRWKLIHFWEEPQEWELYDLAGDPDETKNLVRERPDLVRQLKATMAELRRETGDIDPPGPAATAVTCHGR
jgi:arylsulfatase A-like enzyme